MNFKKIISQKYGSKKGLLKLMYFSLINLLTRKFNLNSKYIEAERVVFVCKGNICRSALAEYVLKKHTSLQVCSIGLDTKTGKDANERIAKISLNMGISLNAHKTTSINDFTPHDSDFYICMEPVHVDLIRKKLKTNRVTVLGIFGNPKRVYLHDPYSSSEEYAKFCCEYIYKTVMVLSKKIRNAE